jgi:predicted AAA+ superfamily ATPase
MQRKELAHLLKWKESRGRKPLIIRGARQTGKTWLMTEFGRTNFQKVAYINFESSSALKKPVYRRF